MNINRDNYEAFFLMYVDNELSAQEITAVELFVQNNTDLQEELEMLQQSIVLPEEIVFKGKQHLFKQEKISAVTEDKLLLYIDRELDEKQSRELEFVLSSDSVMAAELNLLQQTKLSPDTAIIFADKQSLYKKEPNRVIPFGWWKMAAAAVFIGFGLWGATAYLHNNGKISGTETAGKNGGKKTNGAIKTPVLQVVPEKNTVENITTPVQTNIAVNRQQKTEEKNIKNLSQSVKIKEAKPVLQEDNSLATQQKTVDKPGNNLPRPYFENINKNGGNEIATTNVQPQTQHIITNKIIPDNTTEHTENDTNIYAASLVDNSTENKDDRFTFSDDEPKKSKASGFLRKLKRVVERNTKMKSSDDNVKVANLEFAIH